MPKIIEMPKLSDTMTEGTLAKWFVKEGDAISNGQAIADVETDKATMEYASPFEGTLFKIVIPAGGRVPLNTPLAVLLEEGEAPPADLDALLASAAAPTAAASDKGATQDAAGTTARRPSGSSLLPKAPGASRRPAPRAASANGVRVKASPLARKVAEELGVDLTRIEGTGPGGRIVRADVEAAPKGGAGGRSPAPHAATPAIRPTVGPEDERVPTSTMRNIIAERLLASKTQIPHFYLQIDVDAQPLMDFRAQLNATAEKTGGNKYTFNDFVLKAVIRSAQSVPAINAAWDGDAIVKFKSVGLSVAIAVEDGLVTPVIKQAEKKTLLEISQAVKDMAARAKNKKLTPDEFAGGTITVSNLGAYGIDQFSAIINPPQAAILAVGSIRTTPVVNDKGAVVAGQRMWLGLSGDHRVVDGAVAATFLAEVKKLLESPALMLL
jgi:pyruvate dehydrogenase E2 component (dihydrolipoamide acetyltransferase)